MISPNARPFYSFLSVFICIRELPTVGCELFGAMPKSGKNLA